MSNNTMQHLETCLKNSMNGRVNNDDLNVLIQNESLLIYDPVASINAITVNMESRDCFKIFVMKGEKAKIHLQTMVDMLQIIFEELNQMNARYGVSLCDTQDQMFNNVNKSNVK